MQLVQPVLQRAVAEIRHRESDRDHPKDEHGHGPVEPLLSRRIPARQSNLAHDVASEAVRRRSQSNSSRRPIHPPSEGRQAGDQRAAAAVRAGPARRSRRRPERAAVRGPVVPWKGRRRGRRQDRRWPQLGTRTIARRLRLDSPTMRPCASATKPSTRRCTCKAGGRCAAS